MGILLVLLMVLFQFDHNISMREKAMCITELEICIKTEKHSKRLKDISFFVCTVQLTYGSLQNKLADGQGDQQRKHIHLIT